MTTLLVELRNALDRRWRRGRALRLGIPLALALLCGGAAIFRWTEFLGARPQPSIVREARFDARTITLVFDPGSVQMEIRHSDFLSAYLIAVGAVPDEILGAQVGDRLVLWMSPFGGFTPAPRAPILPTLAAILLFLTDFALRLTRHPLAVEAERWSSGTPPGWIESASHQPDGTTTHRLRLLHPLRFGLAICSFFFAVCIAGGIVATGLVAGAIGELPELRLVAFSLPATMAAVFLMLPLGWLCRTELRFRPDAFELGQLRIPWTSIQDVALRLHGIRLRLEIDGRGLALGPEETLWTAGLLEGRGLPVRLETD